MTAQPQHLGRESAHHLQRKARHFQWSDSPHVVPRLPSQTLRGVQAPSPVCRCRTGLQKGERASGLPREPPRPPCLDETYAGFPHPRPALSLSQARSSEDGSEAPGGHPVSLPILQMRKLRPRARKGVLWSSEVSARAQGQGFILPLHPTPSPLPPTTLDPRLTHQLEYNPT